MELSQEENKKINTTNPNNIKFQDGSQDTPQQPTPRQAKFLADQVQAVQVQASHR